MQAGIEDAAQISSLAFALVAGTVVLHGFTLKPIARLLGLNASSTPGVLIVGGNRWSVELGTLLKKLDMPVMISDPNRSHLREAREAGLEIYTGDILSEGAENRLDLMAYATVIAATDNDAYNTLVATDLAPEFGRENVFQLNRDTSESARYALPPKLGGRAIGSGETYWQVQRRMWDGWEPGRPPCLTNSHCRIGVTPIPKAFPLPISVRVAHCAFWAPRMIRKRPREPA